LWSSFWLKAIHQGGPLQWGRITPVREFSGPDIAAMIWDAIEAKVAR
jgi:hypothetical protein